MIRIRSLGALLLPIALFLSTSTAGAVPVGYVIDNSFDSFAELTVTIDDGSNTNVVVGGGTVHVDLDGLYVIYDDDLGTDGTLISMDLSSMGPIPIDVDESLLALDSMTIVNAILSDEGVSAALSGTGSFAIDTKMNADVSGVYPDTSTFGPVHVMSETSGATGSLATSGDQLLLGLFGINIATFQQAAAVDPETAPLVNVKADFTFVGIVAPEPGTAVLMGLGLMALGASRRSRSRTD
jgi:hypothetical protein